MPDINKPLKMSKELELRLKNNRALWSKLGPILSGRPSLGDLAQIKSMTQEVGIFLKKDPKFSKEWDQFSAFMAMIAEYGAVNPANTVSALILSGAAVAIPNIILRPDLDISIRTARDQYQQQNAGSVQPSSSAGIAGDPFVQYSVNVYKKLMGHLAANSVLSTAIRSLLIGTTKKLRVGYGMHTLKLSEVEANCNNFFRNSVRNSTSGGTQPGNDIKEKTAFAPKYFQLKVPDYKCYEQNETGNDRVFWTSFFIYVSNLQDVYNKIDQAIRNGSIDTLELKLGTDIQYTMLNNKSGLNEECTAGNTYPFNLAFDQLRLVQGFFPWSACLKCIEDDNSEYAAVSEVFDEIGDTAQVISQGASIVAAVSGPTVVGAGAAVVSSISSMVSLGCDIAEAVVDIVNFFDDNDYIGRVDLSNPGDYLLVPENPNPPKNEKETHDGDSGGLYSAFIQECTFEREPVNRMWRVFSEIKETEEQSHAGILSCGNSGELGVKLTFSQPMTLFVKPGWISKTSSYGHAEWTSGPDSCDGGLSCEGNVHWGVNSNHTVTFTAGVQAYRFFNHL